MLRLDNWFHLNHLMKYLHNDHNDTFHWPYEYLPSVGRIQSWFQFYFFLGHLFWFLWLFCSEFHNDNIVSEKLKRISVKLKFRWYFFKKIFKWYKKCTYMESYSRLTESKISDNISRIGDVTQICQVFILCTKVMLNKQN